MGERQRVEILKVLLAGARVVVLDEPTSVLTPQEVDALFGVVAELRASGFGIALITHKLREVRAAADRVSVLRGGRVIVSGVAIDQIDDNELVAAMIGTEVPEVRRTPRTPSGDAAPAVSLRQATVRTRGRLHLSDVTLDVHPGEMLGIAGVAGSGQRELCEAVLGLRRLSAGELRLAGDPWRRPSPLAAANAGIVSVPEDPIGDAVVGTLSVLEHQVLDGNAPPRRGLGIDWRAVDARLAAAEPAQRLKLAHAGRVVSTLSGGNIQRVMLVRALARDARVLVAAYPTRGLDVAMTAATQELLLERRDAGCAILLVSEDLDELFALSDRIAVLHDGTLTGVVDPLASDRYEVGRLMVGIAA